MNNLIYLNSGAIINKDFIAVSNPKRIIIGYKKSKGCGEEEQWDNEYPIFNYIVEITYLNSDKITLDFTSEASAIETLKELQFVIRNRN